MGLPAPDGARAPLAHSLLSSRLRTAPPPKKKSKSRTHGCRRPVDGAVRRRAGRGPPGRPAGRALAEADRPARVGAAHARGRAARWRRRQVCAGALRACVLCVLPVEGGGARALGHSARGRKKCQPLRLEDRRRGPGCRFVPAAVGAAGKAREIAPAAAATAQAGGGGGAKRRALPPALSPSCALAPCVCVCCTALV